MKFRINNMNMLLKKFCKLQAKYDVLDFSRQINDHLNDHRISIDQWISRTARYMSYPESGYMLVKFGVNPFISFEIMALNVILFEWPI